MPERLDVHLLGTPYVTSGGHRHPPPRGNKSWALLAYLLATASAPSRRWLAELLFADANDPRGALSWNLGQLRRLLGPDASVAGDPVELRLPPGTYIDIRTLSAGTWVQALAVAGQDLLEGMAFPSSPAFEAWLLAERWRLAGAADSALREAARAKLAAGEADRAVEFASRVVAANPLDEQAQELLIRAFTAAGDREAAKQQLDACVTLFRRELGTEPGQAVRDAAVAVPRPAPGGRPATRASVVASLETGLAALDAGAVDAAVDALRRAVADAYQVDDAHLRTRALLALGSALVHGVRGRDGEGADVLLEAIKVAESAGAAAPAQAHRELGHVELLRGRYDRAQRWCRTAVTLAGDDVAERAWAHAVRGVVLTDIGHHTEAVDDLDTALTLARAAGAAQIQTWALAFAGRSHLLCRRFTRAREALVAALDLARQQRWTAFVPFPESLLADVDLAEGHTDAAAAGYEHAYALAIQLGDPCWEGFAARGIGLVANLRGDSESALEWVTQARLRCVRLPDAWLWVEGYCLDALCALAIAHRRPDAALWTADLEALATRTGMRELIARAYLHRSRLGDRTAADAARVLAAEVDNPAVLHID
jgi:DNA-binding SARP family transcriptional activator